jgi:Rrf2 family protein
MQITRASDYAVRVMIYLASLPGGSTVRQSQIVKATEVSGHFLSKVLQQLVRARLIHSQRGSGGGYTLTAQAASVSLLDVVQAMDGPIHLNQCIEEGPSSERRAWCPAHQVWAEAQATITNVLGSASMASLASQAGGMSYHLHDNKVGITDAACASNEQ